MIPPPVDSHNLPIPFETSPFYRVDSAASLVAICHKAALNDRKSVSLTISLSPDQRNKLTDSSKNTSTAPRYQLRMFSTSETYYNHPTYASHLQPLPPAPTEFPITTDIKLNSQTLTANLRGIKKQPGTAPPPDLGQIPGRNGVGKALDLREGGVNRIDIAYSNSDKRFFCVIYLVEYFGIGSILKNLKANPHRSIDQVMEEIRGGSGDEDVITSSSVLSLNDPVVMSRIQIPIRSSQCSHLQCFDAEMFYLMMESTPTWLCPVCNIKLRNEDIAIDEYFETILKAVPSSVDSVTVEADGTWHDESNRYGNSGLRDPILSVCSIDSETGSTEKPERSGSMLNKRSVTVLELESEEDDDVEGGERRSYKRHKAFVEPSEPVIIDLTLDDD